MHPEKIWIVLVILAVILIGGNLLMLGAVRGMRSFKGGDLFKSFGDASQTWKKEDEGLRELSERVRALKSEQDDPPKS